MKVIITGSAGFIGYHLTKQLLLEGHEVIGIDNLNDYYDVNLKFTRLKDLGVCDLKENKISKTNNFEFLHFDINDEFLWTDILSGTNADFIVHLAAQAGVRYSIQNPKTYVDNNISGLISVLEYCRKSNTKLLYASSSSVYGDSNRVPYNEEDNCVNPLSVYAMTKRANELSALTYNHLYNVQSIGLRFFTVYGPYGRPDMAPYLFTEAAFKSETVKVFNHGNQHRDFTYIDDIILGISLILNSNKEFQCEIYNIGKGDPVHLKYFLELIENITGNKLDKNYIEAQSGDTSYTFADISKMRKNFNYNPKVSIEEGMNLFVNWYKNYKKIW